MLDSEFEIPGYKLFRQDRGSKGGGVAVYVKSEIVAVRRSDLEDPKVDLSKDFGLKYLCQKLADS